MGHPTGDELALLKAVASAPDDDLPRLVYADWLEERGRGERAEFIRLQIADDRSTAWSGREEQQELIKELLGKHREAWFRELPRWVRQWYDGNPRRVEYRRGFVERVNVLGSHFLRFGPQLLDRTPVVRLRVYELSELWRELADCPWLGRAPQLNLSHERLGPLGARGLASNEHLGRVRDLDLCGCGLTDWGVRALADSVSLHAVETLDLALNDLSVAAVKSLRGATFLHTLRQVDLSHNPQLRGHEDRIRDWLGGRAEV